MHKQPDLITIEKVHDGAPTLFDGKNYTVTILPEGKRPEERVVWRRKYHKGYQERTVPQKKMLKDKKKYADKTKYTYAGKVLYMTDQEYTMLQEFVMEYGIGTPVMRLVSQGKAWMKKVSPK